MLTVDVSATLGDLDRKLGDLTRRQVPFASALALTRTVEVAQERVVHEMRDVFDRPKPFTLSSTYIKPATKQSLQAVVALKDFAAKSVPASKFLAAQITGGERRIKRFERALRYAGHLPDEYRAVPGSGAELDTYGNIKPSQIVQILSYLKAFPEAGYKANMTDRRRKRLARGTKTKQGYAYFVGSPGDRLPLGVWARYAFAHGSAIRPVLLFVRSTHYDAVFDFEHVVVTTAHRELPQQFKAALAEAMATAR